MKKIIKTMCTGLSSLMMTLVNLLTHSLFITLSAAACFDSGMKETKLLPPSFVEKNASVSEKFLNTKVHIEVEEPQNIDAFNQIFFDIPLKNLGESPLKLGKKIVFTGKVIGDEHLPQTVETEIKEEGLDEEQLTEVLVEPIASTTRSDLPQLKVKKIHLNEEKQFTFNLIEGFSYFITINPNGKKDRAPIRFHLENLHEDTVKEFFIPPSKKMLTGNLISEDADFLKNNQMVIGIYHSSRLISSLSKIDSLGKFSLELSPDLNKLGKGPLYLKISCPEDDINPCPKISQKIALPPQPSDIEIGTIDLKHLKNAFELDINIKGNNNSPVADCVVILNSTMDANTNVGEISLKAKADSEGKIFIPKLYEGIYDIAIIPPSSSDFAMQVHEKIDLKKNAEKQSIPLTMALKETLQARVLDFNHNPISNAQVEFTRIGKPRSSATENIFDDELFSVTVSTNEHGMICNRSFGFSTVDDDECKFLGLDQGRYLMHITPPIGSNLPHSYYEFDFPDYKKVDVIVNKPIKLMGKIISKNNLPVANAFISIYAAMTGILMHNIILANTITDENGNFSVFLATSDFR